MEGASSEAHGVYTNDAMVVSAAGLTDATQQACRWSSATGMGDLGTWRGTFSAASGVSADGAVVVGAGDNKSGTRGGMRDLGAFPGGP
jgi:uncharacterized membrane protein